MKYFPRLGLYKASNVTFNPTTMEAHSYGWWKFVKRINGRLVFNNYPYSVSTRGHQRKVHDVLVSRGLLPGMEVEAPRGLDNLDSAVLLYTQRIEESLERLKNKRIRHETRLKLYDLISGSEQKIEAVRQLQGRPKLWLVS